MSAESDSQSRQEETPGEEGDPSLATRWSLVTRLKDRGDQLGWREFFDAYWKLIYKVALKSGLTDAEAQEVVQETVISVAKGIDKFKTDRPGSFKGWLLQITRWRIADQFRKRRPDYARAVHRPADDTALTDTINRIADPNGVTLETLWDKEYEKNLMDRALEIVKQRANQKHYQIFHLHVVKGLSTATVCESLGVTPALVYVAKFRISRQVRAAYRRLQESAT